MTCALLAAQAPDRPDYLLLPRLVRGQELVYRGSFSEEAFGQGVQFSRTYRLEARVFIVETVNHGLDAALYTVLRQRTARPERSDEQEPSSVRLEVVNVDFHGHVRPDQGVSLSIPLDAPATVESGMFIELPRGRVGLNQNWEVLEQHRPAHIWTMVGTELLNGTSFVKVRGIQKSPDWDHPRADSTAWRRQDIVWIDPHLGVAFKVERVIERRDPAHEEPTQRSFVQYELQSNLQYPGKLFEDRRREILQAHSSYSSVAPLLAQPTKSGPVPFDAVLAKIANHLQNQPSTPYRPAVLQVQRQVQAAKRGESPPVAAQEENEASPTGLTIGQRAPDFTVTNLSTKQSARLQNFLGHPILMVFYTPSSVSASEVLKFLQRTQETRHGQVSVLAFAMADDRSGIQRQVADLHLAFPVLSGQGLRQTYGVEATPRLVIVSPEGIVRAAYLGWGPETAATVTEELNQCSRKTSRAHSGIDVKGTPSGSPPPQR